MTSSTPEIVRALIDHGARLVARLADGRTALHLAAVRGDVNIVRMIMQKSEENEEEQAKNEDIRKKARMVERQANKEPSGNQPPSAKNHNEGDVDMIEEDNERVVDMIEEEEADSDDEARTTTTGSYIKVDGGQKPTDDAIPKEDEEGPDVYDVNVLAWDLQCSPLHLAILKGHIEVVKELVQSFGADVLLPIKLLNDRDKSPRGAILTLVLSLNLPLEQAKDMTRTLLSLGATSVQADTNQTTTLHCIAMSDPDLLETLIEEDEPATKRAINHLAVLGQYYHPSAQSPLMSAIASGHALAALKLLESGASPSIEFMDWMNSVASQFDRTARFLTNPDQKMFLRDIEQPIVLAIQNELPEVAIRLLEMGIDPNTLTKTTKENLDQNNTFSYSDMDTVLDIVRKKVSQLRAHVRSTQDAGKPKEPRYQVKDDVDYLDGIEYGTYKHFIATSQLERAKKADTIARDNYERQLKTFVERQDSREKTDAIEDMAKRFEELEKILMDREAKTFEELHPDVKVNQRPVHNYDYQPWQPPPFEVAFCFVVPDLTDATRAGYSRM